MSEILTIPLQWALQPRGIQRDNQDSYRRDVMDEIDGTEMSTRQRPGYYPNQSTPPGVSVPGGITTFANTTCCVLSEIFYQINGAATGSNVTTFNQNSPTANWSARQFFDVVDLNGVMYLIGGGPTLGLGQADVWSSKDGGITWGQVTASAPFGARYGHRCVVFNGAIYLMGGFYIPGGTAAPVLASDTWMTTDGANWVQVNGGTYWPGRAFFGACATSGGIFIMGGCTSPSLTIGGAGTNYNDVWFSADGATWTQVSDAAGAGWSPRAGFDVVFYLNEMMLLGGINCNTLTKNNECWTSTDGRVWTQNTAAALGSGTNFCVRLVVYGGFVYGLGGHTTTDLSTIYRTPNGTAWTLISNLLPNGRYGGGICVSGVDPGQNSSRLQSVMYIGGGQFSGTVFNDSYNGFLDLIFTARSLPSTSPGEAWDFALFKQGNCLLMKNSTSMFVFEHGRCSQVIDTRYPSTTVPGIVVLGGFAYVMTPDGLIVNCDFNNPNYWPGQNYIGADYDADGGVAIAKYLNYLIAFGPVSAQFFYDAGTPIGSPLLPYLAGNQQIGCHDGRSICTVDGNLVWYGQDEVGLKGIMTFNGIKGQVISPGGVNRWLNNYAIPGGYFGNIPTFRAMVIASETHVFYVYPLDTSTISPAGSIVYDVTSKQWYVWSSNFISPFTSTAFPFQSACFATTTDFQGDVIPGTQMLSMKGDTIYSLTENTGVDQPDIAGFKIPATVQTALLDCGNSRTKFWGRLDAVGDQNGLTPVGQNLMQVEVTDNDYQNFSGARTMDMDSVRPASFRWGASRRRAWRFIWNCQQVVRVRHFEQEYEQGT